MGVLTANFAYMTTKARYDKSVQDQVKISSQVQNALEDVSDYEKNARENGDDSSFKSDLEYKDLVRKQNQYELELAGLDSEIELLKGQMDAFQKLLQKEVKEATTYWCFNN